MIEIKEGIPKELNAKAFYAELEKVTGKKLHKDFNCTLKFNDDASISSITVIGNEISEKHAKQAAGIEQGHRVFSVGNFFREIPDIESE